MGQLTAGIAHEIKNPLNFVNNFAALSVDLLSELKETAAPGFAALTDDQRAEVDDVSAMLTSNLEKITEHGKRADGIVKAMLEHSRGSSGERRMVDLNALIDEALNLAYHGARAQDQSFNITLERDFGEGIAPIEVNPQDMTRVFLNIFSNGFYAATRRARNGGDAGFVPTLKVTTRDAGEAVEIRVRDNGTGIPADIRDKLFQPFFTTKPTGEGTGLGLSITYDIVTQAAWRQHHCGQQGRRIQRVHDTAAAQPVSAYERTAGFHPKRSPNRAAAMSAKHVDGRPVQHALRHRGRHVQAGRALFAGSSCRRWMTRCVRPRSLVVLDRDACTGATGLAEARTLTGDRASPQASPHKPGRLSTSSRMLSGVISNNDASQIASQLPARSPALAPARRHRRTNQVDYRPHLGCLAGSSPTTTPARSHPSCRHAPPRRSRQPARIAAQTRQMDLSGLAPR